MAKEWSVEDKVVCCVSNNGANTIKAVKILKWSHLPCLVHTINLFVRDALKVMMPTVDIVKMVVEFFHRSTTATEKLKSTQRQMGMPELKLKQERITRWNSKLHILRQILDSKDAVISTLAVISVRNGRNCRRPALFWSHLNRSLWESVQTGKILSIK